MLASSDPVCARFAPVFAVLVGLGALGCKDESGTESVAEVTEEISRADGAAPDEAKSDPSTKTEPATDATPTDANPEATKGKGLLALTRDVVDGAKTEQARDPLLMLPSRATIVVQARPKALYEIDGFAAAVDFLATKSPEMQHPLAALKICGLDLAAVESVTLGMDEDEDGALIVRGPSWGDAEKWRCVRTEIKALAGSVDFTIEKDGEQTYLRSDGDQIRFPDDDTLVLFDDNWERDTMALLGGTAAKSVTSMPIASVIDRVNVDEPVWGAAILPEVELEGTPMSGITEIWGALSVGDELDLTVAGKADSPERAKEMRDEVQKQWDEVKGSLAVFGIPSTLATKIEFKALDDVAKFHMRATPDEVRETGEKIAGLM